MRKRLFNTTKDFKGKVVLDELRRAHIIIVVLALSLIFFLISASIVEIKVDAVLSIIASIGLLFIVVISAGIALVLSKKK